MTYLRIILISILLAMTAVTGSSCGGDSSSTDGKRTIVVTSYPLEWLVSELAADADVEVVNLAPPGVEPHDVELTPRDIAQIRSADAIVYVGGGFQPAVEAALKSARGTKIDVLSTPDLKPLRSSGDDHDDHGDEVDDEASAGHDDESALDPHVWLDPTRFRLIARHTGDRLKLDSTAVESTLESLDRELQQGLKRCVHRKLFTSHEAFGYLADRYDFTQVGVRGIIPDAEPRPKDLQRITELARKAGATTIYTERLVSPKVARTLARSVGARTAILDPIESRSTEKQHAGDDYTSMMRSNLVTLQKGQQCRTK
jgi:zinc transport system substrate-binding protein